MSARATLNGLAGRVVARGPPVAHPWFRFLYVEPSLCCNASIENLRPLNVTQCYEDMTRGDAIARVSWVESLMRKATFN